MDSGNKHDDEVDVFEPADDRSKPVSLVEHIETETNVFFVETLRQAAAQYGMGGGADTGTFEVSKPAQATDTAGEDAAHDDRLDNDLPQKKGGFFAKLFGRGARGDEKEEDSDDLSLDDDMFIAPPPASVRASAVSATASTATPSVDEPATVATVPEVTDSGVFELGPSTSEAEAEAAPETTEEVVIVETVPEVTESGIFELGPSASEAEAEAAPETTEEVVIVETVPEVTESGIFELGPSTSEAEAEAAPETTEEVVIVETVPEVTESSIFELGPSAGEAEAEAVPETTAETVIVATVPEVTESSIFELGPAPAAPSHPHDAQNEGDEWEIGWEPEGEEAAAEFDVSGEAQAAAAAAPAEAEAAPDVPPPVFTKLAHVCIYVQDLRRSVEYYSKIGFRKRFAFNRNGRLFGTYLEFGDGNFIELFEDITRSAATAPGRLAHFCLETPDIDAAMESLSARGVDFSPKKLGCDSTYQIWLKDPDGNEFEIHQYTENSSQLIGGEVEADW